MGNLRIRGAVRGFTLIELAIVVAVIATLMTMGLAFLNAQITSSAYLTTKKRQEAIKDSLIAYLGAHQRLPCPYVPTEGSPPITGKETLKASPPPACEPFGVIPFDTLGLAREVAEDGWGNLFSYQVFADSAPACPGPTKDWGNSTCFGAGKSTAFSIYVFDRASANDPITKNAIAVIISHGPNGLGAWAPQATRNAQPNSSLTTTCEERKNVNGDLTACTIPTVTPPTPPVTPPYYYFKGEREGLDDVVAWIDGREAINTLAKQGAIKSAMAQVTDDLQMLADMAVGVKRAGITVSSTTPPDPAGCNTPINPATPTSVTQAFQSKLASMRDPWGGPYLLATDTPPATGDTFPICIYSQNDGSGSCNPTTCVPAATVPAAICKSIDRDLFNSYLVRSGLSGCPPPSP